MSNVYNDAFKSIKAQFIKEGRESHDWGIVDRKGRALGAEVALATQVFEAAPEGHKDMFWHIEPGTYYTWIGQATRGGEPFGAGQSWNYCKTEEERFQAVQKYLKEASKRAQKWAV